MVFVGAGYGQRHTLPTFNLSASYRFIIVGDAFGASTSFASAGLTEYFRCWLSSGRPSISAVNRYWHAVRIAMYPAGLSRVGVACPWNDDIGPSRAVQCWLNTEKSTHTGARTCTRIPTPIRTGWPTPSNTPGVRLRSASRKETNWLQSSKMFCR